MTANVYARRVARVRRALARRNADAIVVRQAGNIRYLACTHIPGAAPLAALVIPRVGPPVGLVSGLEAARARGESGLDDIRVFSPYREVARDAEHEGAALKRLLEERRFERLQSDSPLPGVESVLDDRVNRMRQVKDEREIDCIRCACRLAALGAAQLDRFARIGRTELQVAADLEFFLRRRGAQGMSYPTIVASGPHAAYSHHEPTARTIRDGDAVTCDFGVYVDGYASDLTRTLLIGSAGREWRGIYRAVRDAQAAAARCVRPGVPLKRVDAAARDLLRRHGLAAHFVHSTGHGLGLQTHEGPAVSPSAKGVCRAGMVITLEPGVYLPGRGGVRIEDTVLIAARGVEWLTRPA